MKEWADHPSSVIYSTAGRDSSKLFQSTKSMRHWYVCTTAYRTFHLAKHDAQEAEDMMTSLRKRMEEMKQSPPVVQQQQQSVVEGGTLTEAAEEIDIPEETDMERTRREIQARSQQRSLARREIQEKEALEKKAREERLQSLRGQVPGGRPARFVWHPSTCWFIRTRQLAGWRLE